MTQELTVDLLALPAETENQLDGFAKSVLLLLLAFDRCGRHCVRTLNRSGPEITEIEFCFTFIWPCPLKRLLARSGRSLARDDNDDGR